MTAWLKRYWPFVVGALVVAALDRPDTEEDHA